LEATYYDIQEDNIKLSEDNNELRKMNLGLNEKYYDLLKRVEK
jgi:hypothetical protein